MTSTATPNDYVLIEVISEDIAPYNFVFVDHMVSLGGKWLTTVHHPATKTWHRCYKYTCTEEEVLVVAVKFGITVYQEDQWTTGKYMHE